jgi:hypothetical protein
MIALKLSGHFSDSISANPLAFAVSIVGLFVILFWDLAIICRQLAKAMKGINR